MLTTAPNFVERGFRELAHRESSGISVDLWWDPGDDEVYVHVRNERDGDDFVLNPSRPEALVAFRHPYGRQWSKLAGTQAA